MPEIKKEVNPTTKLSGDGQIILPSMVKDYERGAKETAGKSTGSVEPPSPSAARVESFVKELSEKLEAGIKKNAKEQKTNPDKFASAITWAKGPDGKFIASSPKTTPTSVALEKRGAEALPVDTSSISVKEILKDNSSTGFKAKLEGVLKEGIKRRENKKPSWITAAMNRDQPTTAKTQAAGINAVPVRQSEKQKDTPSPASPRP
jgi:hypothetical protein